MVQRNIVVAIIVVLFVVVLLIVAYAIRNFRLRGRALRNTSSTDSATEHEMHNFGGIPQQPQEFPEPRMRPGHQPAFFGQQRDGFGGPDRGDPPSP